ncbi:sodium/hydrogen exchanger 8 [Scaptodrosophila lebanonensis]|uniref:Sodium/hydrogen exchanger n=1 Tax=Drosophila lebanonensis TaxID=7225 RepID=A0A6J2TY64_DROLE|nr:sodium/hydrogen exchanger 8 [Scaptodrosophila lebanonensis]
MKLQYVMFLWTTVISSCLAEALYEKIPNATIEKNEGLHSSPASTINATLDGVSGSPITAGNLNVTALTNAPTANVTKNATAVVTEPPLIDPRAVEQEHNSSLSLFFVICVIMLGILLIHSMLQTGFQYLPESIVVVFLGALIGLFLNVMSGENDSWKREEVFSPTGFFLVLLPPIIFESGYNLHKGNFFQNIGSILVFAIFGTTISALVIGAGIYLLGLAEVAYRLTFSESFAFGSLISAVDPVATVAIFHALDVDPILNMLVFGESILNDAISIVLTASITQSATANAEATTSEAVFSALKTFCEFVVASAGIGVIFGLISALLLKHIDLRKHPSLEFGMMLMFTYAPYVLAEGVHMSGIMAILFCGIVMSHYTHFNLSTITQITIQQTMRTLAFIAETCVFAYLGLAIFSFKHQVHLSFVIWAIVLCLIGRACNIFPLAYLVNRFREHKINNRMQFIMWFSGLRGAISYALSLHLHLDSQEKRHVIITTTLIIVLFTTLVFGGSTMPLLKYLKPGKKRRSRGNLRTESAAAHPSRRSSATRKRSKSISLSKTREWGQAIDSEHLSELTEEEDVSFSQTRVAGFGRLDRKYLIPFFTRRFNSQELHECKSQMADLTNKWYQAIRVSPLDSDESDEEIGLSATTSHSNLTRS